MRTKFSIPLFIMLVLFTVVLPNHQFITRVKASLTLVELNLSKYENQLKISAKQKSEPVQVVHEAVCFPEFNAKKSADNHLEYDSSLSFLYLAHSPPV